MQTDLCAVSLCAVSQVLLPLLQATCIYEHISMLITAAEFPSVHADDVLHALTCKDRSEQERKALQSSCQNTSVWLMTMSRSLRAACNASLNAQWLICEEFSSQTCCRKAGPTSPTYSIMKAPFFTSSQANSPKPLAPARLCRQATLCFTDTTLLYLLACCW